MTISCIKYKIDMLTKFNDYLFEIREVGPVILDGYDEVVDYMLKQHENQWRKFNNQPYAYHPARVAKTVEFYTKDKDMVRAALLHDVLEDTDVDWVTLANFFSKKVAKLVQELTSTLPSNKKNLKTIYLIKKMMKISDDALTIKLADRLDNTSDIIHPKCSVKCREKSWNETVTILKNLKEHRKLTEVHKKIIARIEVYLSGYKAL